MNFNIFDEKLDREDLEFVCSRLTDSLQDDTYEVLNYIQNNLKDGDSLIQSAKNVDQFYAVLDGLNAAAKHELDKRNPERN